MFYKVEVRTQTGALLTLSLEDISNGFLIKSIDGLDPVKANLVFTSFAQLDGVQYQASSRGERNIVMKLGYEPDFVNNTVASLRDRLYSFFMPKSQIKMRFFDDLGRTVDTSGIVETMESPLFSKEPEATISIICPDPDFYDLDPTSFAGNSTSSSAWITHNYQGTVETGFLLQLNINRTIRNFSLKRQLTDGTVNTLNFTSPSDLVSGDAVKISTIPGNKFIKLVRSSNEISVLYAMSPVSTWPFFKPGTNQVKVEAAGAAIPYTISYTKKYGGL